MQKEQVSFCIDIGTTSLKAALISECGFVFALLIIFGCVMWILVPDLGWNLSPLQWEHRVLTTRPPGTQHDVLIHVYIVK